MKKRLLILIASVIIIIVSIFFYTNDSHRDKPSKDLLEKIYYNISQGEEFDAKLLNESKKILDTIENDEEKYFLTGFLYYTDKDSKQAIKYFRLAQSKFNDGTDPLLRIYTGRFLASLYIDDERYNDSIKSVKKTFDSIKKEDYDKCIDEIWGLLYTVGYIDGGYDLIIDSLNTIMNSKQKFSKEDELFVSERLASAHILNKNYSEAVYLTTKNIALAKDQNDKFKEAVFKIDLAAMIFQLDGYNRGIELIQGALKIDIDDAKQDAEAKVYAYTSLMEGYIRLGMYDEVLKCGKKVDEYKDFIYWDIFNDILIDRNIFVSRVYLKKGQVKEAKEYLDQAGELLKEDKYLYFVGKEAYYYEGLGHYYESIGDYNKALENYEVALEECTKNDLLIMKTEMLERLVNIYDNLNDMENKDKCQGLLIEEYKKNRVARNEENISYILDKVDSEKEILESAQKEVLIYKVVFFSTIIAIIVFGFLSRQLIKSKKQTYIDALTGINNRRCFDSTYKKYVSKIDKFSVIMIDIDNFKKINDTYGHKLGDTVIKGIAETINNLLDDEDSEYRYGGEEFVVLVKDKSREDVLKVAEKIRIAVESKVWKEDLNVTVSLGVAEYKENYNVVEEADKNLYIAKKSGKNRVI